ncbi:flagellar brake protein [Chitinibacter tainanensis]|uniref:flagellar brake protein n=1 Tax=Chitinibacter tainanensis TaxID=230667 RepID=UPI00042A64DD|nr:flagellar brake protein [Chitinibacter tainanensis]
MSKPDLQPVRAQDLHVGQPLAYTIYDAQGQLLLREGQIIRNAAQLDALRTQGLFRNPLWQGTAQASIKRSSIAPSANQDEPASPIPPTPKKATKARHLPQLKITPGSTLHVQSLGDPLKPKAAVKLIGWQDKAGVLISTLSNDGAILPFREGETLQLKTIAGKDVVSFKGTVEKVCFSPFPYLHLSWPDKLDIHQLRNSLRVNSNLIVSVNRTQQAGVAARVINLSATGAMLEGAQLQLEAGEAIQIGLRLHAAGEDHTLSISATVRNCHIDPPAVTMQYGVEFAPLGVAERLVVEHFIFHALLEQ